MAAMTQPVHVDIGALTAEECLAYLATPGLGRVAVSVRALPSILPVRFLLDSAGEILFRARAGSALATGTTQTVVAFEADGVDRSNGVAHAWSVVATGLARHLPPDDARQRIADTALRHWSEDRSDVLVALSPRAVAGRRVPSDW